MVAGEKMLAPQSDVDALAKKAESEASLKASQMKDNVGQKRKFVPASQGSDAVVVSASVANSSAQNPDEINIDDDE